MQATRQCRICKHTYPLTTEFFYSNGVRNSNPDLSRGCKPCEKERVRWKDMFRKYGVTKEQYLLMLAEQGGKCKLCLRECITKEFLCVDHDHATGEVRGLLCRMCNAALGQFNDDVTTLQRAIDYLTR